MKNYSKSIRILTLANIIFFIVCLIGLFEANNSLYDFLNVLLTISFILLFLFGLISIVLGIKQKDKPNLIIGIVAIVICIFALVLAGLFVLSLSQIGNF